MALKDLMKSNLPTFMVPLSRIAYRIFNARHYYFPYLFKGGRANPPLEIKYEITLRCNLRCIMCPLASQFDDPTSQIFQEYKREKELTTGEVFKLIDDSKRIGINYFSITGGEPFIRKDIIDIFNYTKQKGMRCGILTNGILIDRAKAEKIVDSGLDILQFSLDGPEEVHNKIRKHRNAFQLTIDAANYIVEAKKRAGFKNPYLSFCCTISSENMNNLMPLVDIAQRLEASISFGYLFYTTGEMINQTNEIVQVGTAKGEDQDISKELKIVDTTVLEKEVVNVKKYANQLGVNVTFEPDLVGEEINSRFSDDKFSYVDKCFYPWYGVRVNPYGEVYPCSMNIMMGNLRKHSIEEIWNNKKYIDFRNKLKKEKLFPKCAKCCKLNNKLWRYLPAF